MTGCGPTELSAPPDVLLGTWRTAAPGYERSFLKIEPEVLTIGMGPFALDRYPIEAITVTTDRRGHDRYELHYTAVEGYEDSIEMTVESHHPPTVTLKHPAHPWRRDP